MTELFYEQSKVKLYSAVGHTIESALQLETVLMRK